MPIALSAAARLEATCNAPLLSQRIHEGSHRCNFVRCVFRGDDGDDVKPRYEIGSQTWWATWDGEETWLTCPDCGGMKYIRVILYDDTLIHVDCEGCKLGYEPSSGLVRAYNRIAVAKRTRITGMEMTSAKIQYRSADSYIIDDGCLFDTEAEALAEAQRMAAEADRLEREKINQKEKPTRSWSWHVHYHRGCLRRAEREIAYHSARLAVARVKAKEPA